MSSISDLRPLTSDLWRRALPLVLFAALWLDLIRLLSGNWEAREQYAYGYFVPFFAAALLWRRWQDRPVPRSGRKIEDGRWEMEGRREQARGQRPEVSGVGAEIASDSHLPNFLISAFCFLLCLSLLPLRVIFEINADWPLIAWVYTTIVVILTLYAFHLADPTSEVRCQKSEVSSTSVSQTSDLRPLTSVVVPPSQLPSPNSHLPAPGSAPPSQLPSPNSHLRSSGFRFHPSSLFTPWVKHFFFPVAFILVALVWPYRIEKGLTQSLMQVVAGLTVEILGWINIPALQSGNLIEISNGVLGVDEACSGIRSFQSTLMAGLLMGEFYRLRLLPRISLVAIGLALAFSFNIVRTFLLSYQAEKDGMSAVDKWHDPAGFTIAIACFLCLWAISALASKRFSSVLPLTSDFRPPTSEPDLKSHPSDSEPTSDLRPLTSANSPQVSGFWFRPSARAFMFGVGAWSLLAIASTESWYRSHANPNAGVFHWSAAMPTNQPTFKSIELPPRTLKLLSFDEGMTGRWVEDDGSEWILYFFRWNPHSVESVIQSRNHRPDVCLPAAGLRQVSESQLEFFEAGDLKLPFRSYVYEAHGRKLYVFFCQWEDGAEHQAGLKASKQEGRLQSVLSRRRIVGQQTLELILTGYDSLETAKHQFQQKLPLLIVRSEDKQRP